MRFLDEWLADRAYYRISLTTDRAAIGTDNPDQRIAEDIRIATESAVALAHTLVFSILTLAVFIDMWRADMCSLVSRAAGRLTGRGSRGNGR